LAIGFFYFKFAIIIGKGMVLTCAFDKLKETPDKNFLPSFQIYFHKKNTGTFQKSLKVRAIICKFPPYKPIKIFIYNPIRSILETNN